MEQIYGDPPEDEDGDICPFCGQIDEYDEGCFVRNEDEP